MPEIDTIRVARRRATSGQSWTLAVVLAAAGWTAPSYAKEAPLWELGLGAGFLAFNDYRGSATTHVYPLPVPYFVYRGTFLKSDRDGLRGLFLNQTRVELSLSVNATTPVHNDSARHGMPDLRPTLELGPELDVHLGRIAGLPALHASLGLPRNGSSRSAGIWQS